MTAPGGDDAGAEATTGRLDLRPALVAALTQAVVLTLGSVGYGFHRDELYFRMLPPAWGYIDQPPLTPWLARTMTAVVADEPWALRIPATVASAATVVLLGVIARELGGDRRAVALAAWGGAFAGMPLAFGHVLVTATIDLPLTLAVVAATLVAVRRDPRWWLVAGAITGVALWNRLLIPLLIAGIGLGLAIVGPRRVLLTRWPWLGALLATVVGLPNLVYQGMHGWPQLAMGRALSATNADDVRGELPLMLLIALGPPLVLVCLWGAVHAWRTPSSRWLLAPAVVVLVFTVVAAAQPHYPVAMLEVLYAAGCVPLSAWIGHRARRRRAVGGAIGLNAAVSLVVALPVIPVGTLGSTPVPGLSALVADQVGWPRYVDQVATAYGQAKDPAAVIVTSNYGEAGAIARYGPALGLPAAHSGHNDLGTRPGPPATTRTVLFVGYQLDEVSSEFTSCLVVARLDNGLGVDNEEQGAPVAICRDPVRPWSELWPRLAHLD